METNFSIKNLFKAVIIIILFFDSSKASTISGLELTNIIEEWLQNRGKPANISILEELKYPKCEKSKLLITFLIFSASLNAGIAIKTDFSI